LPALPKAWSRGRFNGVCARDAFELDMQWKDGRISRVTVLSKQGHTCRIQTKTNVKVTTNNRLVDHRILEDGSIEFDTQKGSSYMLVTER